MIRPARNNNDVVTFAQAISDTWVADINEKKLKNAGVISVTSKTVIFEVDANSIASLCVKFKEG